MPDLELSCPFSPPFGFKFTVLPLVLRRLDPIMFRISLDTRIEVLHPYDAGRAIANGVLSKEIWEKILLVGGGIRCQIHYRDYLKRSFRNHRNTYVTGECFWNRAVLR